MTEFFEPDKTYRHYLEDGCPSEEGLFQVAYVGRAPEPFECYSETLGVAFGWRQGIGPNGNWEALGSYVTPDFVGWREVRAVDDLAAEPDGCRWCGDTRDHHGTQYAAGIGQHQWAAPSDRQRLGRMQARRDERLAPAPEPTWDGDLTGASIVVEPGGTGDFIAAMRDRDPAELETLRAEAWQRDADASDITKEQDHDPR